MKEIKELKEIARDLRLDILEMTTRGGSGHPSSSWSAVELLCAGETLDDFGGYTFYRVMDRATAARELNALPVGLAPRTKLQQKVAQGEIVTWDDVVLDENSAVVKLRRMQDAV